MILLVSWKWNTTTSRIYVLTSMLSVVEEAVNQHEGRKATNRSTIYMKKSYVKSSHLKTNTHLRRLPGKSTSTDLQLESARKQVN